MEDRRIAHIDLDAFFFSAELQRRPELRGKPVVVAGSGPRAVVTTASYEARKFGIFSATPAARARRLCPDAIFVPPDHELYRSRSHEVMEILRSQVDRVEQAGLDEAYLDLTGIERWRAAARQIKAAVIDGTGLGCSIGIGPSKLVAKVASDADKPDGFIALTQAEARARFADASPSLIPGIGPKSVERLARHGIERLGQLATLPDERLTEWFGPRSGPHLGRLARFEDDRELETSRIRKSESRETTFDEDLRGLGELEPALDRLSHQLCDELTRHGRSGRTIGIKVRLDDFSTHTRARTVDEPTNDVATIATVARELLRALDPQRPVRLLGVRIASMEERQASTPDTPPPGQLALSL